MRQTTRQLILLNALDRFNQAGATFTSTNEIATICGISPGNLYYHFKNKEDIIVTIFGNFEQDLRMAISAAQADDPMASFIGLAQRLLMTQWEYRFIGFELNALIRTNTSYRSHYADIHKLRFNALEHGIRDMVQHRYLKKPNNPSAFIALVQNAWLVVDYWINFLDTEGRELDQPNLKHAINLLLQLLHAHFTQKAQIQLRKYRARSIS